MRYKLIRASFLPDGDKAIILRVVKALICVSAGVVPSIPPVLYEEGGALECEGVHAHLSVHKQL